MAPQHGGRTFPQLIEAFRTSFAAFDQPADFIIMMVYCMPIFAPIRICMEAGLFKRLASSAPNPVSAADLAAEASTAGDEAQKSERQEFITRMLRAVCACNLVDEAGPALYLANEITVNLADPGFEAGFVLVFDHCIGPNSTTSQIVKWAKDHDYIAPPDALDGPYQQAFGIKGTTTFNYWVNDDKTSALSNLNLFMQRIQPDRLNWSEWFPANIIFTDSGEDGVFMVDVGGGLGHDLSAFAQRYPEKKVKLILEDQPSVLDEAKAEKLDARIEMKTQDFFQKQTVPGAKIYFMHKILHDWPDPECVTILSHLRDAMTPQSRIFINDVILPDQGSPLTLAAFDIVMLAELSGKERSEDMWKKLISQVDGLVIKNFWQAPGLKGEGIVEVGKQ